MTSTIQTTIPGFVAGTWTIDPVHTDISFTAKHMVVSKVRGHLRTFSGTLVTQEDTTQSSVTAGIDLASLRTTTTSVTTKIHHGIEAVLDQPHRGVTGRFDGSCECRSKVVGPIH